MESATSCLAKDARCARETPPRRARRPKLPDYGDPASPSTAAGRAASLRPLAGLYILVCLKTEPPHCGLLLGAHHALHARVTEWPSGGGGSCFVGRTGREQSTGRRGQERRSACGPEGAGTAPRLWAGGGRNGAPFVGRRGQERRPAAQEGLVGQRAARAGGLGVGWGVAPCGRRGSL